MGANAICVSGGEGQLAIISIVIVSMYPLIPVVCGSLLSREKMIVTNMVGIRLLCFLVTLGYIRFSSESVDWAKSLNSNHPSSASNLTRCDGMMWKILLSQ